MSSFATPAAMRRPATLTVALVLILLLGLSVLIPFNTTDVPGSVIVIGYVLAALKIAAGIGLWWCRKWAAILGFVIVLLDALLAAPGMFAAPTTTLQVYVIVGILASIVALVLLVLPASRHAYV